MSEETINIIPLYEEISGKDSAVQFNMDTPSFKEEKKPEEKEVIPDEKPRKGKNFAKPLINIISGNIFTREEVLKHLPYVLFLAFIALLYIANGYYAEDTVRQLNKASNELKELRSEYITTKSDLMYISKQSEVANMAEKKNLGLKESIVPPQKIVGQMFCLFPALL
mgnify:CR=1 FL=1